MQDIEKEAINECKKAQVPLVMTREPDKAIKDYAKKQGVELIVSKITFKA